jgi:anhydro-N-acetylmuramic acid kinase
MGMIEGRLAAYAGRSIPVLSSVAFGVPDQAREAMAFAVLGHESLMGRPGNLPAVTGASRAVVLGSVTL